MATRRSSPTYVRAKSQPHWLVRFLWMVFIGWWLGNIGLFIAYLLTITVIGLPLGFWLINRLPALYTLRTSDYLMVVGDSPAAARRMALNSKQVNLVVRLIYFILIGWWLGLIWANVAFLFGVIIIGLPISFLMFERLAAVTTLYKT